MKPARGAGRLVGGRLVLCAGLLAVLPPCRLTAQAAPPLQVNWFLKGLHAGLCVEFLISPTTAEAEVAGRQPTPIDLLAVRYPVLARAAQAEPAFQGWIPAEYCWFLYRSAVVGGRVAEIDEGRQPVMVGYLSIAATSLPDSATAVAVGLFTNSTALERAMGRARLQIDLVRFTMGLIPSEEESRDRARYEARHRGATIQWDGGKGTPRTLETKVIRLVGFTSTQAIHQIRTTLVPDSTFAPSGNLRVLGDGKLQQMLAASPIRLMTSYQQGGDADWMLGK